MATFERTLWTCVVLFVLARLPCEVEAVDINLFYPFGPDKGDTTLEPGDDQSSKSFALDEKIILYNTSFSSIYINVNGHVSFDSEVPDYRADLAIPYGLHMIAIFLADVDTRASGRIYYRSTSEEAVIQRAAADIQTYFSGFQSYMPSSLFIVTWDRVGYYKEHSDQLNTFQMVLVSDGQNSFSIFHYRDNGMEWTKGDGKFQPTYQDIPPQAGFEGGKGGHYYTLPGSAETGLFVTGSNMNVPGVWMYRIGDVGKDNVKAADLNTGEVTLYDVEKASDNCFQSSHVCHTNAQCVDHDSGFCCACVPPFYGNGIRCLSPGVPQKLNGRVYGTLNGIPLDNDLLMHTYVVVTDGRTYSAISRVPSSLGPAMQTLNSIGGIIGWLFATPLNAAVQNGYSFTGGKFNRTAKVTFQSADRSDYVVQIYQVFMGHDSLNNIRMETRLEGSLPEIPMGATVSVDDYKENYKRTALGTIKSFAVRTYRVNDVAYRYTWDNTITFEECDDRLARTNRNDVMRLTVSRHYVKHSEQDQVVRFAMTSKVGVFAGGDPCANAAQNCAQQADCVPIGDSYRCVCRAGYTGDGANCQDIDECQNRPCGANSRCYNVQGSFQCQCDQGYSRDGNTCRPDVQLCGEDICSSNARCVFLDNAGQPRCECNEGYQGDGIRCSRADLRCNEADICGSNAQCVYDSRLRQYVCEEMEESSGDGEDICDQCDRYAQCVRDVTRNEYRCECEPGYTGDGRRCSIIDTCQNCDRHARCVFNDDTGDYECVCTRGYAGDGTTCSLRDCREVQDMCDADGGLCWLDPNRNIGICRCTYGYRGNGFNCERVSCDVYNDCDDNAKCVSDGSGSFSCQCDDGYSGDGKRCQKQVASCDVYNDCDGNARCVPSSSDPPTYQCRCNPGYSGDGKTCRQRDAPCNQVNNCDRNAECMYNPDLTSYQCVCARGFEGDGLVCRRREVMDCRRTPSMCSDNGACVQGSDEEYVCVCSPGFRGDGATCSPVVREGNYLIYAQGTKLLRVSVEPRRGDYGQQLAYISGQLAVGVTTDCLEGMMYWTDAANGVIRRARLDGTGMETIVTGLKSPEGVAVDHVSRNMYFTDSEMDSLQVSRLDGSDIKTLVNTDMVNPRDIVLDVGRGTIYWTDWSRKRPQIERIDMDGKNRATLVTDGLRLPNGLAFDTFSQTLCWGDAGTRSIECVRSDGVGRRVVEDQATYPFDITLLNNVIYWSDWSRRDIPNVNQSGGQPNAPLRRALGGHGLVYGITAVRDQCPRAMTNSCALNNGGCQYLCLASPNGGRTCACPDGVDPRLCNN